MCGARYPIYLYIGAYIMGLKIEMKAIKTKQVERISLCGWKIGWCTRKRCKFHKPPSRPLACSFYRERHPVYGVSVVSINYNGWFKEIEKS